MNKCQNQLAWRKLKSLKATFPEIIDAVATSDKKRFALLHIPSQADEVAAAATTTTSQLVQEDKPEKLCSTEQRQNTDRKEGQGQSQENTTEKALAANDPDPSNYLIRATQGHSIKTIDATSLLEKLSLADESKLPTTVVHGTFHSAWPAILESGGLRCMGRNHVHFATGPSLDSILPRQADGTNAESTTQGLKELGLNDDGRVISGMRRDAQVLIYVDLKKALAAGCPFWRSENGVILSEGMEADKKWEHNSIVPLEFVDVVVERKHGLGKIWEDGKVVQELPGKLTQQKNPKGKGGEEMIIHLTLVVKNELLV